MAQNTKNNNNNGGGSQKGGGDCCSFCGKRRADVELMFLLQPNRRQHLQRVHRERL